MAKPVRPPTPQAPVDWSTVHARLALAATATQSGGESSAHLARDAEILAQRARALARPATAKPRPEELLGVVLFELGGQSLALDAACVRETLIPRELTPLPGMPPCVRGLANVRSRVLPVFDLRPLLQLPATAAAPAPALLIVAHEGTEFALLADQVVNATSLSISGLRHDVPGLNQKYLRGLSTDGHLLLDLAALFPDLIVDDDASA